MSRFLIPTFVAIALTYSACGPSAPPSDPAHPTTEPSAQTPDSSPPDAVTSPAAAPTPVRYSCGDASVISVTWGNEQAHVEFPGGRAVTLPKAQSASKGGDEVFVGDTVSLQRDGDDIQLFDGEGPARQCAAQKPVE